MIDLHFESGSVLSFDGRVIEFFPNDGDHVIRRHIAHVKVAELLVDKKQRYRVAIQMERGQTLGLPVSSPEAIEQAQKLVAEVERVRASL